MINSNRTTPFFEKVLTSNRELEQFKIGFLYRRHLNTNTWTQIAQSSDFYQPTKRWKQRHGQLKILSTYRRPLELKPITKYVRWSNFNLKNRNILYDFNLKKLKLK